MEKSITSNSKLKYILLSILFLILFIFTALFISKPISAYATGYTLKSDSNGKAVNGTEVDSTSTANYLFWAASEDRTGILFYIIDNTGCLYGDKKILIMDDKSVYRKASKQDGFTTMLTNAAGVEVGDKNILGLTTPPGYSTKPVTYSDGWHATGNVNTLLNATITVKGEEKPYWFYYASILINTEGDTDIVMNDILASNSRWAIVAEPVSIQYIYSNSAYNTSGTDTLGHVYSAGDPLPAGSDPNSDDATPYIFCGTARGLAQAQISTTWFDYSSPNPDDGGIYTYKFLNMSLPWSMCLEHDQSIAVWTDGMDYGARVPWSAPTGNGEQLSSLRQIANKDYATGIYFIDVSVMKPPIHTFGGSTPGNTEKPDPPKDGKCTIKKLYYTQIIASDGTIIEEATDYHYYTQEGTTNYISIDNEEGYELEGWKTSGSKYSLSTKANFDSIPSSDTQHGTSAGEITLNEPSEKYLYVLLKKTEIDDTPHEDYDFRLEQSQITKRVTFLEGMGPANTPDLITHNFTWTAPAPTITSCTAHGGYGHHLKHDKEWDTEPVEGVPHKHADHSDEISYYKCGYTYSCPAGCKAIHKHHTHKDDECIGYKKFTCTTPLCPSGCTKKHTHHFAHHTDRCYTVCNKVWDVAPVKR